MENNELTQEHRDAIQRAIISLQFAQAQAEDKAQPMLANEFRSAWIALAKIIFPKT